MKVFSDNQNLSEAVDIQDYQILKEFIEKIYSSKFKTLHEFLQPLFASSFFVTVDILRDYIL